MRSYANMLRELADAHDLIAESMEKSGIPELDTPIVQTAVDGLDSLAKYLGEAFRTYQDHVIAEGLRDIAGAVAILKQKTGRAKEEAKLLAQGPAGAFVSEAAAERLAKQLHKRAKSKDK